jgi:hypothetical protein
MIVCHGVADGFIKKGLIGNFSREGHAHTQAAVEALDHNFPSAGKAVPAWQL